MAGKSGGGREPRTINILRGGSCSVKILLRLNESIRMLFLIHIEEVRL